MAVSRLSGLSSAVVHDLTVNSQRFLASAYDTVDDLLTVLDTVRIARKADEGKGSKGILTSNEQDILRACVVLAGAGLDASLKRLVRDAFSSLVEIDGAPALRELHLFTSKRIASAGGVDAERVAELLLTPKPRDLLVEAFIESLVGSSIQSVDAVQRIATVLGIPNGSDLRKDIKSLRLAFVARNQIAHELDLQVPAGFGDRQKHTRTLKQTLPLIHGLLEVPQLIINEVGTAIPETS